MQNKSLSSVSHQQGTTLLEALVSLVILSIGLLGLAGFQYKTMQSSDLAKSRAIVSYFAEELISNAATDPGNVATKYTITDGACTESANTSFCNNWKSRLTTEVPNLSSSAIQAVYTSADGTFAVTIKWKIRQNSTDEQTLLTTTNLKTSTDPSTGS